MLRWIFTLGIFALVLGLIFPLHFEQKISSGKFHTAARIGWRAGYRANQLFAHLSHMELQSSTVA